MLIHYDRKGKGLRIAGGSNIIIQNIRFSDINAAYVWGGDAIAIDGGKNIWVSALSHLQTTWRYTQLIMGHRLITTM